MRPQWKMGVIQATEALAMSLDDRLANFIFMYDDNGPHLNPCILDKLKPESSAEAEARLSMGVAAAKDGPRLNGGHLKASPQRKKKDAGAPLQVRPDRDVGGSLSCRRAKCLPKKTRQRFSFEQVKQTKCCTSD